MKTKILVLAIFCSGYCLAGQVTFLHDAGCEGTLASASLFYKPNELYEGAVALKYLRSRPQAQENVMIASEIMGWQSPAFDGVITDPHGKKVANISIKGVRIAHDDDSYGIPKNLIGRTIRQLVKHAARMTAVWSEEERWDQFVKYSRAELDVLIANNPSDTLVRRKAFLDTATDLFSIPTSKSRIRTRIVVAISDKIGNLEKANDSQIPSREIRKILVEKKFYVESVTVLSQSHIWNFDSSSVKP